PACDPRTERRPWALPRASHPAVMARGPRRATICTGMLPPGRGEQPVTLLTARQADLRKREHLDTRAEDPAQRCFRSSRAGFVDHAGRRTAESGVIEDIPGRVVTPGDRDRPLQVCTVTSSN